MVNGSIPGIKGVVTFCLCGLLVFQPLMVGGCGHDDRISTPTPPVSEGTVVCDGRIDTSEIGGTGLSVISARAPAGGSTNARANGGFEATVSSENSQLLFTKDDQDSLRALVVSVPPESRASADSLRINAESTALSLLMLTPGILASAPDETRTRIAALAGLSTLPTLTSVLRDRLRQESLRAAMRDPLVSSALRACVEEWVATTAKAGSGISIFTATAGSSENPRAVPVTLANGAWRFVNVQRRDADYLNHTVGIHPVAVNLGCMMGGTAVSWGSLLSGTIGDPTTKEDQVDFSTSGGQVTEAQYWVSGLGLGAGSMTWPENLDQDISYPAVFSTIWYVAFPVIDIVLGGAELLNKGQEALDQVWSVIATSLASGDLISNLTSM